MNKIPEILEVDETMEYFLMGIIQDEGDNPSYQLEGIADIVDSDDE